MAAHRVDLVDEDDAGGGFLALLEHVAHTRGADADEHLDEVGAGNGEERNVGLAGDGARQQRLASAGRTDQQHALGDLAAETLELLRVLEELDDLLQLGLGLVDAGHVLEGDAALLLGEQLGARLAEAHGAAAAGLHLAHDEEPGADDQQQRRVVQQVAQQRIDVAVLRLGDHFDALAGQTGDEVGILRRVGLEAGAIGEDAGHVMVLDHDRPDMAGIHVADEVRISELLRSVLVAARLEDADQQHQQQSDDDPEGQIPAEIAHLALQFMLDARPKPSDARDRATDDHRHSGRRSHCSLGLLDWDAGGPG